MKNRINKIQIRSNSNLFGTESLLMEEVEQMLTIYDVGNVVFEAFNCSKESNVSRPDRKIDINIGVEAVEKIFNLINRWLETGLIINAVDAGLWEMDITCSNGKTYKYEGAMSEDLEVDGILLSGFIRKRIPIDNLFVFDGGDFEEFTDM